MDKVKLLRLSACYVRNNVPRVVASRVSLLEEGIPYQTFIASVLHKYASGRLVEKPSSLTPRSTGRADKRRIG